MFVDMTKYDSVSFGVFCISNIMLVTYMSEMAYQIKRYEYDLIFSYIKNHPVFLVTPLRCEMQAKKLSFKNCEIATISYASLSSISPIL